MRVRAVRGVLALAVAMMTTAPAAALAEDSGGIVGWVEDGRGVPVAGAVISLFGQGLGRTGLVTLSDSGGRFVLPSLPTGSYTLRAISDGLAPSLIRGVTVLPDRDAVYTLSLKPATASATPVATDARRRAAVPVVEPAAEAQREWAWLMRHKKRSVLEERGPGATFADSTFADGDVSSPRSVHASLELLAAPWLGEEGQEGPSSGLGVVRLAGRFAGSGEWKVRGLLSESEDRAWRMAGEFALEPNSAHVLRAGTGYGSLRLRPRFATPVPDEDLNGFGAIFVEDRWTPDTRWTVQSGVRVAYLGFLSETMHVDPTARVAWRGGESTLSVAASQRTLGPGGDLLTIDSLSSAPAVSFALMTPDVHAERVARYEAGFERPVGGTRVGAHVFHEDVRDQLLSVYEPSSLGTLRISNGGDYGTRGVGLSVGRNFSDGVQGSLNYTYGYAWRAGEWPAALRGDDFDGNFHDLSGRLEAASETTGTRVVAYYRLNLKTPERRAAQVDPLPPAATVATTRFDVQLAQDLPFLRPVTRAEWELLVAVRNLFYEPEEGAIIDELAVSDPPTRILGGFSIRF